MAKKKPIYEKMSAKLKESGFNRDSAQIGKKIANLREEYRKKKPGATGDERPSWIHFEALHKILHERPALNEEVAVTSEVGFDQDFVSEPLELGENGIETDESENHNPVTSPPKVIDENPKKRSRLSDQALSICNETLNFLKDRAVKRDEEREELKKTNEILVSALNRIASSSESMADSVRSGTFGGVIIRSEQLQ